MPKGLNTARLYQQLLNTGLQGKDNPLYQVIWSLIQDLVSLEGLTIGASATSGGGGTVINQTVQQFLASFDDSGIDDSAIVIPGPQGPQGIPGTSGSGSGGLIIMDGVDGMDGFDGFPGLPGKDGKDELTIIGLDGLDGEDGIPGMQGLQGIQGIQGLQGIQGIMGIPGMDGNDAPDLEFMFNLPSPPTWIQVPYASGDFTSDSGTWVVDAGDVINFAYCFLAPTIMVVTFESQTTTVTGTPYILQVKIPAGKSPIVQSSHSCYLNDNGTDSFGLTQCVPGNTNLRTLKIPIVPYTASTNNSYIRFTVIFQVAA